MTKFYTNTNKLKMSLQALPVNSLAVIAAELMANIGPNSDFDEETEDTIRELPSRFYQQLRKPLHDTGGAFEGLPLLEGIEG